MAVLAFILGTSGTGKSYSMRNFEPEELAVINVQGKILPFKGSGKIKQISTDDSDEIVSAIESLSKSYKVIVIDDFQYVMSNEFMRRAMERGYDKFTEIARHAWDIANTVRTLPDDVIVYIMCHTDIDPDGREKIKTIGRLLDEKIVLEGMSTIVLKTVVSDGKYGFVTQNNGKDTVKSPFGMFPANVIDNDLKYVDEKIRNYYEIGDYKTDEQMKEADATAIVDTPEVKEKKKRGKKKEEKQTNTLAEETKEKPKRSERIRKELNKEATAAKEAIEAELDDEPPFLVDPEPPKRKRRSKAVAEAETEDPEEPPKRNRRKKD